MQIITQYNFREVLKNEQLTSQIDYITDLTVPNQGMIIDEIVKRFQNGETLNVGRQSYYGGENLEDFDETQQLNVDPIDVEIQLKELEEKIKNDNEAAAIAQKTMDGSEGNADEPKKEDNDEGGGRIKKGVRVPKDSAKREAADELE